MKSRDIFQLAVRIAGLFCFYHGTQTLPLAVIQCFAALGHAQLGSVLMNGLAVIWPLVLAFWLLRGAPLLMHIAYPEDNNKDGSTT